MYLEALSRINDADILEESLRSQSNASAILRILAFEVLLKSAIVLSGQTPKATHKYQTLWLALPGYAQKAILKFAEDRMPGHTDFADLNKLLSWYQYIFEKARYGYEILQDYTTEEQSELMQMWLQDGTRTEDALEQYYPDELVCLTQGLCSYIESNL